MPISETQTPPSSPEGQPVPETPSAAIPAAEPAPTPGGEAAGVHAVTWQAPPAEKETAAAGAADPAGAHIVTHYGPEPAAVAPPPAAFEPPPTKKLAPGEAVVLKIVLASPAERVFRALVDPAELSRWYCRQASVEARAGGKFTADWQSGQPQEGTVEEIVENRLVRLMVHGPLQFRLEPEADGRTLLEVTIGPWLMSLEAEQVIWSTHLLCLKAFLDHGVDLREPDAGKAHKDGFVNGWPEP